MSDLIGNFENGGDCTMNKWVLMAVGFAFFILVGVGTIMVSDPTAEETAADATLLMGVRLTSHGTLMCRKAIESKTGVKVYEASATLEGDRATWVTLEWTGRATRGKFEKITCTYAVNGGVTSLRINDEVVLSK
jgi:hypothetical protein